MTLERKSLALFKDLLERLEEGFTGLPPFEPKVDLDRMESLLENVAIHLHDNYPYPHPLYAGQMLKPPHPIAHMAYFLAMWINPNNHALDGGRASSKMEKEAVAEIAGMFGWEEHLGHLCGGGTMANLEALWIADSLAPGKVIAGSSQAHYTHSRISEVLKIRFEPVSVDARFKMDLNHLEDLLRRGDVGTVVATLGTTGVGSIDPLPDILQLRERYGFRIHVDAAYGGYFSLAGNMDTDARQAFDSIQRVDSIVVDPHKHGLQPYGCGCVLFRDPSVGKFYKHDSPYTYFSSDELHLGEISLECSRPGASAVALWATMKYFPLVRSGEFAGGLEQCREAALTLFQSLEDDPRFLTAFRPELDILIWAPAASTFGDISSLSKTHFDRAASADLHLATVNLPVELLRPYWPEVRGNGSNVLCLRSCLMKPEHLDWVDRIWEILDRTAGG